MTLTLCEISGTPFVVPAVSEENSDDLLTEEWYTIVSKMWNGHHHWALIWYKIGLYYGTTFSRKQVASIEVIFFL